MITSQLDANAGSSSSSQGRRHLPRSRSSCCRSGCLPPLVREHRSAAPPKANRRVRAPAQSHALPRGSKRLERCAHGAIRLRDRPPVPLRVIRYRPSNLPTGDRPPRLRRRLDPPRYAPLSEAAGNPFAGTAAFAVLEWRPQKSPFSISQANRSTTVLPSLCSISYAQPVEASPRVQ